MGQKNASHCVFLCEVKKLSPKQRKARRTKKNGQKKDVSSIYATHAHG